MGRLGSRKTTTGCLTCKIRRVKCDEQYPACRRCSSTGRTCDGYSPSTARNLCKLFPDSSPQNISAYKRRGAAEIQAFEFFIHAVIPDLTRVVDTDFWHRLVLQTSQTDDAVWNATNAMACLIRHQHCQAVDQDCEGNTRIQLVANQQVALQWYTRSINELQTQMARKRKWSAICSITAVLYICIECLFDNMQGALFITQQAMQAMHLGDDARETSTFYKEDSIQNSVDALLRHIIATHGFRVPTKSKLQGSTRDSQMDLTDARDDLYELIGESHEFVCQVETVKQYQPKNWQPPAEWLLLQKAILQKLHKWAYTVPTFPEDASGSEQTLAISCALLAQAVYVIWVSAVLDMSEMAFDAHNATFESMLDHAETAINAHGTSRPTFSFETRVIPCIIFAATRCRHPAIRRRAIELLYRGPKIENTRRASSAISMAKCIVAIEESGNLEECWREEPVSLDLPPETNRIIWAKIRGDGTSERCLNFGRWRLNDNNEWYKSSESAKI